MIEKSEVLELKEKGTESFKSKDFKTALSFYKKALKGAETKETKLALHKNIAACYLKLDKHSEAVDSCTAALDLSPVDVKALYRRSQAHEKLGDVKNAFKDMANASRFDPNNKSAKKEAARLMQVVGSTIKAEQSSKGVSDDMVSKVFTSVNQETRKQALKNCVVLARENHGARHLMEKNAPEQFLPLLDDEDEDLRVHTLFLYSTLVEGSPARAKFVIALLKAKGQSAIDGIVQRGVVREVKALCRVYGMALGSLSENEDVTKANEDIVNIILLQLIAFIPHRKLSLPARAAAINSVMHSVKNSDIGLRFLHLNGVNAMLITAANSPSPLEEHRQMKKKKEAMDDSEVDGSSVSIRNIVSVCLQRIYETTKAKGLANEKLVQVCKEQIQFVDNDVMGNIPAVKALIAVLAATVDVGNQILEDKTKDVFPHLMALAKTNNAEAQCVAAEAISFASSDKKRARGILLEGGPILKTLYKADKDDVIRVRALCGLCKMASVGSGAKNLRSLNENTMIDLAKKLRPFLISTDYDEDTRKWASEGLAFLSLDADVKEFIISDENILKAVHKVCMGEDPMLQFSLANMLVNLTNSFDKPEKSAEHEELKKLGKFAGENIPEPHELDAAEFVLKRVDVLVKHKFVTALVALGKTESEAAKEQVARVLLAMTEDQKNRGVVVAQGGAKTLLTLTRNNTTKGSLKAAHALAKIAITNNPEIAFPGQRSLELVKPLVMLSREFDGLMMFESAMALTNLAGMNDTMRNKMFKEKAVQRLEDMMFDEDAMIRRAATEGLCNCFYSDKIFKEFATKEGHSFERLKLWILFSGVEQEDFDLPTCMAASGGLALLSQSKDVCERIVEENQGLQILKELLVCGEPGLQHRGLHIVRNMVEAGKDIAEKFTEKEMLVILTALFVTSTNDTVKQYTENILQQLVSFGFVESLESLCQNASQAAKDIQAAKLKAKEDAKARMVDEDEDEDGDEDENNESKDDDDSVDEIVLEKKPTETTDGEDDLVAPEALEELDGPKVEIIE
eukprot:m.89143 g.89143  ORF g.89143 m.89143 type:complete len:1024 (+) comp12287_c0_seq2:79-3150(+)